MQGCCPHRDSPSSPSKIAAGILGAKSFQEMVLRFQNRNTGRPCKLFVCESRLFCAKLSSNTAVRAAICDWTGFWVRSHVSARDPGWWDYLPTPDMPMSAPKEEEPPDGGFSIQPDDLGSRGHQDCTRTDCTHTYPSRERQVLSGVQTGQCRALAKVWKCMSNPTSAAEAESLLASGSFVELTSHFVQIGVRVHRQVGALR